MVGLLATSEKKAAATYCHYLPVHMGGVSCRTLIDSGNTWRTVISLDLAPWGSGYWTRASAGAPSGDGVRGSELTVEVMGVQKRALKLHVPYLGRNFKCLPAVVKGLSMPANISGPWLELHGWDHLHTCRTACQSTV